MVEIDNVTLFEILIVFFSIVIIPIFVYFWRQNTWLNKDSAKKDAEIKLLNQKLDNHISNYNKEVESSNKQHERMEGKIDELLTRVSKLEK